MYVYLSSFKSHKTKELMKYYTKKKGEMEYVYYITAASGLGYVV